MRQQERIAKLERDLNDLLNLGDFGTCNKCGRYYVKGYLCQHCNNDNSEIEGEDD